MGRASFVHIRIALKAGCALSVRQAMDMLGVELHRKMTPPIPPREESCHERSEMNELDKVIEEMEKKLLSQVHDAYVFLRLVAALRLAVKYLRPRMYTKERREVEPVLIKALKGE